MFAKVFIPTSRWMNWIQSSSSLGLMTLMLIWGPLLNLWDTIETYCVKLQKDIPLYYFIRSWITPTTMLQMSIHIWTHSHSLSPGLQWTNLTWEVSNDICWQMWITDNIYFPVLLDQLDCVAIYKILLQMWGFE